MEVPGLNSGKFFLKFFCAPFFTFVTALLEYLDPMLLHLFGFPLSLCNSIAIQSSKRHYYDDHTNFQVIPMTGLPCSRDRNDIFT